MPHLWAGPSHRGEPHADSTALLGFRLPPPPTTGASAHLTTRTLTRTDATSAVTSHMRNKRIENWRTARGGGGPTVIDSRGTGGPPGARRADRESYRERALHPTAVRSVIQAGLAKLAAVSGSPAAPDGGSLTCTSISEGGWPPGSGPRAGAWSAQGGSHPSASGCKRSNARTPPGLWWP
jgi:hypothetical protein